MDCAVTSRVVKVVKVVGTSGCGAFGILLICICILKCLKLLLWVTCQAAKSVLPKIFLPVLQCLSHSSVILQLPLSLLLFSQYSLVVTTSSTGTSAIHIWTIVHISSVSGSDIFSYQPQNCAVEWRMNLQKMLQMMKAVVKKKKEKKRKKKKWETLKIVTEKNV